MLEPTECRAISPDIYITEYKRVPPAKKRRKLRKEAVHKVIPVIVLAALWGWVGWTMACLLFGR